MKNRQTSYLLLLVGIFLFLSCQNEERLMQKEQDNLLYCTDTRLSLILIALQTIETENSFIQNFAQDYGIPMWEYADIIEEEEKTSFFIPVYNEKDPKIINTIWFFQQKDGYLTYTTICRGNQTIIRYNQEFLFDYLSYTIFGEDNASGLIFRDPLNTRTRIVYGCTDSYVVVGGVSTYKQTLCKEVDVWENPGAEREQPNNEDKYNGKIPIPHGGGGGGGGSSSIPKAPLAKAIFRNSSMTSTNWQTLENMIEKLKMNCMGEALYNGLKSLLNGKTVSIQFNNTSNGSFGPQGESVGISLSNNMESNQLLHEMLHAYQAYQGTLSSYNNSTLNGEIEAWYAQYLYTSSLPEYKRSKWERRDYVDPRRRVIKNLAKYINPKGSLLPNTNVADLEGFILNNVKPTFNSNHYTADKYSFDYNKAGLQNFNNLRKLTINCP